MKRTHRLTALAAALLLLLALLAGCGASSGVTADSASDSASAPSSNEMAAADSGFSTEVAEETTDARRPSPMPRQRTAAKPPPSPT